MGKCSLLWSRSSPPAVCGVLCPRKTVPRLHSARNLWCSTEKSSNQVFHPLHMPLSPANQRTLAVTCRVFCFWRSNIPSSKCTPRRGVFSPSAIQEIPIPLCVFLRQHPPPQEHLLQLLSFESHILPKPQSLSYTCSLQKVCDIQYPSFPSPSSRDFFFLCEPDNALFQPLSLSLSLPFLSMKKGLPILMAP